MKTCKNCGGECNDLAVFCEHCGSGFSDQSEKKNEPDVSKEDISESTVSSENSDEHEATSPENEGEKEQTGDTECASGASGESETLFFTSFDSSDFDAEKAEEDFRNIRKNKILSVIKSPAFIVLCVSELMALLSGIFVNLTATPGSTITIPITSLLICLGAWMLFLTAKNKGTVSEGWIKFFRVLITIFKVIAWITFGAAAVFAVITLILPAAVYDEAWRIVAEELLKMGFDMSEITDALSVLRLSIKVLLVILSVIGCAVSVVYAIFYGKLKKFLGCVEKEARGDLPGIYPAGVAGFCWFYTIMAVMALSAYMTSPPYNVFTVISYAADVAAAAALATVVQNVVKN